MDPLKITAVKDWLVPSSITGYYRRFIHHHASIAHPLTNLLRKDHFKWSLEAQSAFDTPKKALISAPVLRLPDFSKPFIVETDASSYGIGAILSQDGHPIAFFSKKLSKRMQQTSAYVRELYAITEAVAKFRHYLFGHYFIIRTDQRSLRHLTEQTLQTPEQEAFLPKLLGYNFTIEYKTGHSNTAADGLSRSCNMAVSISHSSIVDDIRDNSISSPFVSSLVQDIRNNGEEASCYSSKNGLLYWKDRVVVPPENEELLKKLLVEFHSSTIGGHAGFLRTYARIATYFYWPGMRRTIREFVRHCQICQRAKSSQLHPAGLLSPLPIPNQVWEDVAMDFITGLPTSKGYTVIMVVIDRLSKYAHFAALRANYTAHQVAELFVQTVVKLHGIPRSIVSDRDKVFTSAFWSHLFKLQGTSLNMSSAYHPQTDGQSEALNKCLELYLRCFVFDNPRAWVTFLPWAEFWYNSAFHTSIGMTPFKALYGRDPPSVIPCSVFKDTPCDVQTQLQARDVVLAQLKINIDRAQAKMKKYADKKRRELEFAVGDFVYVKLQPYRQLSVKLQRNQKLGMRYFGPFQVVQKIGSVAYKLALPLDLRIHPIFHISFLKPCIGDPGAAHVPLPLLSATEGPLLQPVKILDTRKVRVHNEWEIQVLVQWDGTETPTWESWNDLQQQYPNFDLEDKVCFEPGRNVMSQIGHVASNEEVAQEVVRKSRRVKKLPQKLRE
ncbi:ty3-gypsy retrotransposon protein [Tanacetum coccineum]